MIAPHSRRRLVLIGIAASISMLLGSTALVRTKANARWQEMVQRGKELRTAWDARPATRAPLWGTAEAGDAFAHYEAAARSIDWESAERPLAELIDLSDADLAAAEQFVELRAQWATGLQHLRAGAHASMAQRANIAPGQDSALPLREFRPLANIARLEANILRHKGRHQAAIERTLDALTMASDIFSEGVLINQIVGVTFVAIAVDGWPEQAVQQLDPESAATFAEGLAKLDQRIPTTLNMDRELLFMIENVQHFPEIREWCGGGTWDYGFSQKWMLADAFLQASDIYDRFASGATRDHAARKQQFDHLCAEAKASGNHAIASMLPNLLSAETAIRDAVARLRLLRVALDLQRGLEPPTLPDPHANANLTIEPLTVEPPTDAFILRSVGRDPEHSLTRTHRTR